MLQMCLRSTRRFLLSAGILVVSTPTPDLDPATNVHFLTQVVTPTSDGNSVDVQYDRSDAKLDAWAEQHGVPQIIVATGFIAKNPKV